MDNNAVRLYNKNGVHILSLVKRWDGQGYDFVEPDRPGTHDGNYIGLGIEEDFAKYIEESDSVTPLSPMKERLKYLQNRLKNGPWANPHSPQESNGYDRAVREEIEFLEQQLPKNTEG